MNVDDLKNMSLEDLQDWISCAQKVMYEHEEERKKSVIKQIHDLAAAVDLEVEIRQGGKKIKPLSKGIPKYQNPENPKQTWTGRGKRPKWLTDALDSGRTLDEFTI